ncbi:MAG: ABC transporter substrate-binding protein [Lactobacillaceae bacterium]|jgi:ABC-type branched-subunit amino acid transport system substrate-binding protein|nr:ABC transporter substrate-binding protein [Lactobacillaceae bacterium]
MVNDKTKKIILLMTVIVIAIMAYLVHSPKFRHYYKGTQPKLVELKNRAIAAKGIKIKSEKRAKSVQPALPEITIQKVKIGISLPLTGEGAIIGNAVKQSLEMAQSETPQDTKYKYEIIFNDSNGLGKSIEENTAGLITSDKVDVMLSLMNKDAEIVGRMTDGYQIPHITCAYGREAVKEYKYTFNHFPTPETKAKSFIKNLEDNNIKIFSIVAQDVPYINEILDAVENEARENNYPIYNKVMVKKGTSDFSKEVDSLVAKMPEAVMVMLEPDEMEFFAEQLDNAAEDVFVYTSIDLLHNFYNKKLVDGAIYIIASDGDFRFKTDFRKRSVLQVPLCAVNLYDAYKMIVQAYEKSAGSVKPKSDVIYEEIYTISDFPSASGADIKVSLDRTIDSPMIGVKIEKGFLKYE